MILDTVLNIFRGLAGSSAYVHVNSDIIDFFRAEYKKDFKNAYNYFLDTGKMPW